MRDLLDNKLERIEREFLLHELKKHSWNVRTLAKKYCVSEDEIQRTCGGRVNSDS